MPGSKEGLKLLGKVKIWTRDLRGRFTNYEVYKNLIVDTGKGAVARRLIGDTSKANTGEMTFGAVGTGPSSPTVADTTLETELFRKVFALRTFTANKATFRLFLGTGEANGTLTEFAIFGEDASATPDSGTMMNRVNINKVKTNVITLTIEAEITVG